MRSPTCEAASELLGRNFFVAGDDEVVGCRVGRATRSVDLRRNSTVSSRNLRFLPTDRSDKLVLLRRARVEVAAHRKPAFDGTGATG